MTSNKGGTGGSPVLRQRGRCAALAGLLRNRATIGAGRRHKRQLTVETMEMR